MTNEIAATLRDPKTIRLAQQLDAQAKVRELLQPVFSQISTAASDADNGGNSKAERSVVRRIREMRRAGKRPSAIAEALGVPRALVYRHR